MLRQLFIQITLLGALFATTAGASERELLTFAVENADPVIRIDGRGEAHVDLIDAGRGGSPGQPALPYRALRLAVPPDAIASSVAVRVIPLEEQPVAGRFDVAPNPPIGWVESGRLDWGPHAARIEAGRDRAIYDSPLVFPETWGDARSTLGTARRFRFVTVELNPVRYRPADGILMHAGGFRVEVSFERGEVPGHVLLDDCAGDRLAARLLDNYEQALSWYPPSCAGPPDRALGLAIITTGSIADHSEVLDDYVQLRSDQGYGVTVATEADWDVSTGELLDDRADRIRAWLQANMASLDLGWVLLIGNPDPAGGVLHSIPMKPCGSNGDTVGPTDFYYADISGTWDATHNGIVCEWGFDDYDPEDEGTIDFVPELYVGRFPVYSDGAKAADEMLARAIAYEEATESGDISWRRRMMLPNSIYFFDDQYADENSKRWDGATVGEWFIREQLVPRGMLWTTLYEKEGLAASQFESHFPLDDYNTVGQWVRSYGFVFMTGHGSNTGIYRSVWNADDNDNGMPDGNEMSSPEFLGAGYTHMLTDSLPPFVVHGSCSNGYPESADNFGYSLLRYGAIGTISASREAMTWHFPSQDPEQWDKPEFWNGDVVDIVTEYSVNLLDGMESGRALDEAIAVTLNGSNSWYQKSIQNLYGDPLIRWVMCREDADCDNDVFCDGEELCDDGSCVPGEPVTCDPVDGCEEMVCDEELGCVPGPECDDVVDTDTGTGAAIAAELPSATAGCQCATVPATTGTLVDLLLALGR